ncbi:NAD(P)-dependent oxidoreductase [Lapidilactobacillus wuchangensis]|uniref:NAD(P)-dependent oxidoreductase n=1 Tax=Lapidilactobacillus wuchangensis TaxID=2486001 RepID=UPI000F77BEC8|nr:NAD(P)H-binding protein [Lapidilactobacillus wuchangensis]
MKIAIIGATGKSGQKILAEAIARGLDVTAIVRSPAKLTAKVPVIQREVLQITATDLAPFAVIISAFGNSDGHNRQEHVQVMQHYVEILKNMHKRLLTVGAASYLFTNDQKTKKFYDTPMMRLSGLRAGSLVLETAYTTLRDQAIGFNWTVVAPAVTYSFDRPATGHYHTGAEVIQKNAAGKSIVSYADFAAALLDEVQAPQYLNQLMSVSED